MSSLAEALPTEIKRVRDIRDMYVSLRGMPGVNVEPVIFMIDKAVDRAIEAAVAGDAIVMLDCLERLKGFKE